PGFGEYFGISRKRRRLLLMVGGAVVAMGAMLALGLPDVYTSSGLIEIESADNSRTQDHLRNAITRNSDGPQYADQYVQSLSTIVLGDRSLDDLLSEHQLYDDQQADPRAARDRLRRDIDVDIVTVPILDPQSGRERELVTAFKVGYGNRDPQRAQ